MLGAGEHRVRRAVSLRAGSRRRYETRPRARSRRRLLAGPLSGVPVSRPNVEAGVLEASEPRPLACVQLPDIVARGWPCLLE